MIKSGTVLSLMIIALMSALVSGATLAWFSAEVPLPGTTFTAGTVDIIVSDAYVDGSIDNWTTGECITVDWTISNTGSKAVYLRAKVQDQWSPYESDGQTLYIAAHAAITGNETAWGLGTRFGGGFAMYFEYINGSGTPQSPVTVPFVYGSTYEPAGLVSVWNNNDKLYVKIQTDPPRVLYDTQLYVGLTPPTKHSPGQLGFYIDGNQQNQVTYELDYVFNAQTSPISKRETTLVTDLSAGGPMPDPVVTWTPISPGWQYKNGYWYYCNESVPAGGSITLTFQICLEGTVPEGREYSFHLEVDAVQSSHNAISVVWPGHPCQ
ncbi:MAG: SipW-dependent-type signal peptide-containing protein [Dethiobacter sp.]|jgi:predicted ribosomally synthesized peptide with SipW-like signal peptide|nr:SipW-dependent-type signal peptide-containing protein [Dethiobacter sp.]